MSWMKKLTAENKHLKEEVMLLLTTNEDLTKEMTCLATDFEEKTRRQENMELRMEELQYKNSLMEMDFDKQQDTWKGLIEGVMEDLVVKQDECEKIKNESGKMGKFINNICVLLDFEERLEFDEGGMVCGDTAKNLDHSLKIVGMEILKMVEERKMLRKNDKELNEMDVSLKFEGKVLGKDSVICTRMVEETGIKKNSLVSDKLKVQVIASNKENQLIACDELVDQNKELENKVTILKGSLEENQADDRLADARYKPSETKAVKDIGRRAVLEKQFLQNSHGFATKTEGNENRLPETGYERCEKNSAQEKRRRVKLEKESHEFANKTEENEAESQRLANVKNDSMPENVKRDKSLKQNRGRPKLYFLRRIFRGGS